MPERCRVPVPKVVDVPPPPQGRGKKYKKAKMGEELAMYYNEEVRCRAGGKMCLQV